MINLRNTIMTVIGFLFSYNVFAQGCSDAGFCTIGNLKHNPASANNGRKQKLSFLFSNGIGDESVYVFTPGIQYENKLNQQWTIQAKLTANYASGNLGNASGLGDLVLVGSYTPKSISKWKSTFTLASKLPLNSGNIKMSAKPLPMQYQSSLGTIDGIIGYTITNEKWKFSTAFQQPFTGTNQNTFLPAYWNTIDAIKYSPSNDFKRKADGLLRVGYQFNIADHFIITTGLLGIYHFGNDTYIDANVSNAPIELKGSSGLTLNGTAIADYSINQKLSIGLTVGAPFVVRDIRPDGLTRAFVVSPEFIIHF